MKNFPHYSIEVTLVENPNYTHIALFFDSISGAICSFAPYADLFSWLKAKISQLGDNWANKLSRLYILPAIEGLYISTDKWAE